MPKRKKSPYPRQKRETVLPAAPTASPFPGQACSAAVSGRKLSTGPVGVPEGWEGSCCSGGAGSGPWPWSPLSRTGPRGTAAPGVSTRWKVFWEKESC